MSNPQNKHNLVDPSSMNQVELDELRTATNQKKQGYVEQEKATYQRIKGKLWFWWFLPVFGWIIYSFVYNRRLEQELNQAQLIAIKTKIAECELQAAFIARRQKVLDNKK